MDLTTNDVVIIDTIKKQEEETGELKEETMNQVF